MIMAGRGRRLEDTREEVKRVGTSQNSAENIPIDLPTLLNKITEIDTNDANLSLLLNIQNIFEQLFTSKDAMRDVISNLHTKALEDAEFGEKVVLALENISHLEVDGTLVRGELLSFIQNDFKAKETMAQSNQKMLLNSVLLLGNVYHRFKVCGAPIAVLGIALLEYFDLLMKGGEDELKVLTKQILINGTKLSQMKNYEILIQNLRTTLVTTKLNSLSRCWILLAVDFISNDLKPLKKVVRDFYVKNLGEEYTKLESLVPVPNELITESPTSVKSAKSPDSTSTGNKNFNFSPNKTDGFKKDFTKKFSDMNIKSGNGNKEKTQSLHGKNNKKDRKYGGGDRRGSSSGHDDRFEKEENFYGVQKPRQPKPFSQKKKLNDTKDTMKENDNFKADLTKKETQQETEENKLQN